MAARTVRMSVPEWPAFVARFLPILPDIPPVAALEPAENLGNQERRLVWRGPPVAGRLAPRSCPTVSLQLCRRYFRFFRDLACLVVA